MRLQAGSTKGLPDDQEILRRKDGLLRGFRGKMPDEKALSGRVSVTGPQAPHRKALQKRTRMHLSGG